MRLHIGFPLLFVSSTTDSTSLPFWTRDVKFPWKIFILRSIGFSYHPRRLPLQLLSTSLNATWLCFRSPVKANSSIILGIKKRFNQVRWTFQIFLSVIARSICIAEILIRCEIDLAKKDTLDSMDFSWTTEPTRIEFSNGVLSPWEVRKRTYFVRLMWTCSTSLNCF